MDKQEFLLHPKPQVRKHNVPDDQTTADSPIVAKTLRYTGALVALLAVATIVLQHLTA